MCSEWKDDFNSFKQWALANGYSHDLSIDRIDNDGDYSPTNCRWITKLEQNRNRSTSVMVTIDGETHCLKEWCERYGTNYKVVWARIKDGSWGLEEAIATPTLPIGATRNSIMYTIGDATHYLSEWCEIYNIRYDVVWKRINRLQWDVEKALTTPIRETRKESDA